MHAACSIYCMRCVHGSKVYVYWLMGMWYECLFECLNYKLLRKQPQAVTATTKLPQYTDKIESLTRAFLSNIPERLLNSC